MHQTVKELKTEIKSLKDEMSTLKSEAQVDNSNSPILAAIKELNTQMITSSSRIEMESQEMLMKIINLNKDVHEFFDEFLELEEEQDHYIAGEDNSLTSSVQRVDRKNDRGGIRHRE